MKSGGSEACDTQLLFAFGGAHQVQEAPEPCSSARRGPMVLEAFGEARTVVAWAHALPISPSVLRRRARKLPAEVALRLPKKRHVDLSAPPGGPGSWTWEMLPFEEDSWAQAFVRAHPSGATLEAVGDAVGLCKERVRQIEESALKKFRAGAAKLGVDLRELARALAEMR